MRTNGSCCCMWFANPNLGNLGQECFHIGTMLSKVVLESIDGDAVILCFIHFIMDIGSDSAVIIPFFIHNKNKSKPT